METHSGIEGCENIAPIEKCEKWEEKGFCSKSWCSSRCPKTCNVCEDEDEDDSEEEVCNKSHFYLIMINIYIRSKYQNYSEIISYLASEQNNNSWSTQADKTGSDDKI